ncbi:MAG TPA: DUF1552 domain-containing protein [Chthonomonadaceae bacterium]|nr:DUF1552 domain-containing protein [Chthonomonadaceae bacterium]
MPWEPISRRTLLRGLGTAIALPMLEAMLPLNALAQSAAKARVNRMAFLFIPNGVNVANWMPATEGPLELTPTLASMKNVKDKISIITGLSQHNAFALGDGGGDHARSTAAWLTGVHPKKTDGADLHVGISVDQVAAQRVGRATPFASLELGCERGQVSGACDTGYSCAYSSSISWRGPSTPNPHEVDPRAVFERLFGNNSPGETAESRARRQSLKQSVLDFVLDDAASLKKQLGVKDQAKLDEYFTGVREIEDRLARIEKINADPAIGDKVPAGVPPTMREHIRLMCDMMTLAFQADLTRICTFMIANDGSNRSYKDIGVPEGHHDMSHHGHDPYKLDQIAKINKFHAEQVAYFLEKLDGIHEPDGTLLDNSMIVYGAGISDGDRHNHDNLPILLAGGGAGTIKQGRHLNLDKETPLNDLFLSMLDRMGVHVETLGDSTGRLTTLI